MNALTLIDPIAITLLAWLISCSLMVTVWVLVDVLWRGREGIQ